MIGVVTTISAVVIVVLNPLELLRQTRDANRLSDLQMLAKSFPLIEAIGVEFTDLDGPNYSNSCQGQSAQKIFVSVPADNGEATPSAPGGWQFVRVPKSFLRDIDGTGWVPVDLRQVATKVLPPFSHLSVDPINTFASGLYYSYVCGSYEFNAVLESKKYASRAASDSGDDDVIFETGSKLVLTPPRPDILSGLVANWKLDEGSGTTATDSSGNNNTGTLTDGPTWTTGKIGSALNFDGVNDLVAFPGQTLATFTYSAWINHGDTATYQNILRTTDVSDFAIYLTNGDKINFFYAGSNHTSNTVVPLNSWAHIAVVNNAGSVTFYLNGVADGTATGAPSFTYNGFGISNAGSFPFLGKMDDVRIYNRALSTSDIQAIYNLGSGVP